MDEVLSGLNRVFILALDGLEYNLVEEFDLKGIKQREYGKVDISMFKELATPIIWASFITGLPPQKHGLGIRVWNNLVIEKLRELSIKMKLDRIKGKGKVLTSLGFKRSIFEDRGAFYERIVEEFRHRNLRTLFDVIPSAKALSVPPYQKWISRETSFLMKEALENEKRIEAFENHVWDIFECKRKEYKKAIREDEWNLFMVHFMFMDLLGHIYAGNLTKMFGIYAQAEQLVEEVKKIVGKKTFLLVVSDHGMKPIGKGMYGDHSDHGFYSSSVKLSLVNPKITDFFPLIITRLTKNN